MCNRKKVVKLLLSLLVCWSITECFDEASDFWLTFPKAKDAKQMANAGGWEVKYSWTGPCLTCFRVMLDTNLLHRMEWWRSSEVTLSPWPTLPGVGILNHTSMISWGGCGHVLSSLLKNRHFKRIMFLQTRRVWALSDQTSVHQNASLKLIYYPWSILKMLQNVMEPNFTVSICQYVIGLHIFCCVFIVNLIILIDESLQMWAKGGNKGVRW